MNDTAFARKEARALHTVCYRIVALFVFLGLATSIGQAQIVLNSDGYFQGPGFNFLIYHNNYIGGRQGGLQMLLHGTRVMDAGNLFCRTKSGEQYGYDRDNKQKIGARQVAVDSNVVTVPSEFPPLDMKYDLLVSSDEQAITISVQLDKPVDWNTVTECVLKIEVFPEAYFGATYMGGGVADVFQERHMGRKVLIPEADTIVVAPEDPQRSLTFRAENALLSMRDERRDLRVSGFMVFASLPPGSQEKTFSLTITPKLDASWRRKPVIQISQVGYHPQQRKVAVIELDSRTTEVEEIELRHLDDTGAINVAKSGTPQEWGPLYDYHYHTFDFTDVVEPGLYFLSYGDQQVGPFRIDSNVYRAAWHPTMDTFFPVQMCHVKVRDFLIVWHGACHVEDALQAPPNKTVIDGYRQGPETETQYQANEHVPGLDWGGWHDAGDFDLAAGAVAGTVLWLALAQEEFPTDRDVTSVSRSERLVELYEPDGKTDMLQQVAYGMQYLLGLYRGLGHVGAGVIANNGPDYGRVGDPTSITDGLVYDPKLHAHEQEGGRSGTFDDRWVFTNRNTGGQYQFVQVAAIASRVLRGHDDDLADECLDAAKAVWEFEQANEPAHFQVAYQPQEDSFHSREMAAAVELYLTTGEAAYKERLVAMIPDLTKMPAGSFGSGIGFTLVRALPKVDSEAFHDVVLEKSTQYSETRQTLFSKTPYGVDMHFGIWGNNWTVLQQTARLYFFARHFPEQFDAELVYAGLNYNFGCHPATNHSYVSGVGAKSATIAFGFNRNDSTYIPGGVVSGASLIRPKFPEYRERPWDWYQTEYVIQGSAAYVFDVLAVDALLNHDGAKP